MKSSKKASVLRIATGILALSVVCASMAGCGGKKTSTEGDAQITYWTPINGNATNFAANWDELPIYQKLQENTGVDIEFIHPSGASVGEQFSILLASKGLPDLIQYNWSTYAGGPGRAIKDKVIIDLYQHKDKFPNLVKYLEEHEEVKKNAVTNDGELFSAPFVRGDKTLCVSLGMAIRQDWLTELGLEAPETIAEWDTVLTAFKERKGASAPLNIGLDSLRYGLFAGAYDTCYDYYLRDGKVTHGFKDAGFKDLLMQLNDWYKRGLLDNNFASIDGKTKDSNMLNGQTGAMQMSLGGGIGKYLTAATEEGFDLVGVKSAVLNKGDYPEFGFFQSQIPPTMNGSFTAVSADCTNIDAAAKVLDYGYTEEGCMLYNFGVEGESYNIVDGYPKYTEEITNNAEGYAMSVMLSKYTASYDAGPFIQDTRYMEQYAARPQQQAAWDTWTESKMPEHLLPNLYVSGEDQKELSTISNNLKTYMDESITKLIMGTESFDNYDKVIEELENRGLSRAIEIYQKAYEGYLAR